MPSKCIAKSSKIFLTGPFGEEESGEEQCRTGGEGQVIRMAEMPYKREAQKVVKTELDFAWKEGRLAFVLDNVFSEKECKEWIEMTESKSYEPALVNIGGGRQMLMPDVRNNMRCIIDSEELADKLFQRIKPFLPAACGMNKLVSLNERLRFLRYDPGEKFEQHYDGAYTRPDGSEMSRITVQLYLNEGFQGGCTNFLDDRTIGMDRPAVPCVPKTGRVLIFEHRLLHEGEELRVGRKYAMRTDAMYTYRKG